MSDYFADQRMSDALKAIVDMSHTLKEIKSEISNIRAGLNQIQMAQTNIAAAAQRR